MPSGPSKVARRVSMAASPANRCPRRRPFARRPKIQKVEVSGQVKLFAVDRGEITSIMVGMPGAMGQAFVYDLRHKTKRGLTGKIVAGLSAAGPCGGSRYQRRRSASRRPTSRPWPKLSAPMWKAFSTQWTALRLRCKDRGDAARRPGTTRHGRGRLRRHHASGGIAERFCA
jgi:hypothetical protein